MLLGTHAIVIGAGMGGLAAAGALARYFERVTVIERDDLLQQASPRPGTPQSSHPHGLLQGGLYALTSLFPGFDRSLVESGAVAIRAGIDLRYEIPGYIPIRSVTSAGPAI